MVFNEKLHGHSYHIFQIKNEHMSSTWSDHKDYFNNSLLSDYCVLGTVLTTANEASEQSSFVKKNEGPALMELTS